MLSILQEKKQFAADILAGLGQTPKTLPSKYFYDANGDALFRKIMTLPEYYLTRCEFGIFEHQASGILSGINRAAPLQLIELGAGDGSKTKLLLKELQKQEVDFKYFPIDISGNALEILCRNIEKDFSSTVSIQPIEGDYFTALASPLLQSPNPKLVLFLGSNIGNFKGSEATVFMGKLSASLNPGDQLLVGFDLKKDPAVILDAYNDKAGVTKEFNLNLLRRINKELDANFDPEAFIHYPVYDPLQGAAKSYLVSKKKQQVVFSETGHTISFSAYEPIFMEVSQKFDEEMIRELGYSNGLKLVNTYTDDKGYFADVVYEKV